MKLRRREVAACLLRGEPEGEAARRECCWWRGACPGDHTSAAGVMRSRLPAAPAGTCYCDHAPHCAITKHLGPYLMHARPVQGNQLPAGRAGGQAGVSACLAEERQVGLHCSLSHACCAGSCWAPERCQAPTCPSCFHCMPCLQLSSCMQPISVL